MVSSNDKFWEWRERLFLLRGKYKDTPPGFRSDEEALREWERFIREKEEYAARNRHRIQASYCPPEEPFVGREGYLEEIQRRFQEWESPVVLYGIGGIGKTALARAYIRKHRQDYDAVLFLSCQADLKSVICDDCQLPIVNLQYSADKYGNKNRYFKEKIKVLQDIAGETRLLLVFDDCNMDRDAKMATVFSLPCHILVTTRMDPSVWGAYKGIRIRELETDKEWAQFVGADQDRKLTPEEIKAILEYREQVNGHTLFMMMRVRGIEIQGDLLDTVARDLLSRFRLGKMEKQALREESERGAWYDWEGNWEVLYHYALLDKAKILLGMERNEEAEALCREGLGYVRRVQEKKGAEEFRENEFKSVLVEVLAARGEFGQAKELCRDMVEKAERYRGRYFKDTLSCREQLGDVCMAAGDFREAGEEYEAVRSFLRREYPYQEEWIRRIDEKLSGSRTARPHMAGENRGDRM